MIDTIYTIGYSGFSIDEYIKALHKYGISSVIDVRSTPYSRYFEVYNAPRLKETLNKERIHYRNYDMEFGARQKDKSYYPNGYLDFELFSKSESFQSGLEKLEEGMRQGFSMALMCSEKDPLTCHRAILVSRAFHEKGYKVIHILPHDKECTQEDIETRLLALYAPSWQGSDLFTSREDVVADAYREQNKKIGYTIEKEVG